VSLEAINELTLVRLPKLATHIRLFCHIALFVTFSSACLAQNEGLKNLDYQPMISDLNVVAPLLAKEKLSNGDVAMVAAVGCGTARVALRNRYAASFGPFLRSSYPSQDTLSKINLEAFLKSEDLILQKVGASPASRILVAATIKAAPQLPPEPSAEDNSLNRGLQKLERDSCSVREQPLTAPTEPASEAQTRFARCVGRALVGTAVIVADGFAAAAAFELPVAATIIAAISGGWGWNRVEEGCF